MKLRTLGKATEEIAEAVETKVIRIDEREKMILRAHLDYARKIRRDREDARRINFMR